MARQRGGVMKAFSLIGECAEKSELVRRLVVELTGRGLRVSTIKRVSDAVDLERPGAAAPGSIARQGPRK
jgi:molybdopterin-guanine dinucleotide biosynthesis protein